jgi:hypothetical protein
MAALTALTVGMAVAGTAMNAYGQIKQGKAARDAGESQAQREEFNAGVAEQQAKDALVRGREEESHLRSQVRQVIGGQRAALAAQGVDVGMGSAVDVQNDTMRSGELDALTVRNNAKREAWGFQVEAQDRRYAADIARRTGQQAYTASKWGAANAILGTGANLMSSRMWGSGGKTTGGGGRPLLANTGGNRIAGLSGAYGGAA